VILKKGCSRRFSVALESILRSLEEGMWIFRTRIVDKSPLKLEQDAVCVDIEWDRQGPKLADALSKLLDFGSNADEQQLLKLRLWDTAGVRIVTLQTNSETRMAYMLLVAVRNLLTTVAKTSDCLKNLAEFLCEQVIYDCKSVSWPLVSNDVHCLS
jgi:hypothetical protein